MTYRVIGNEGCIRCGVVCEILKNRNIDYTYHYISNENDRISKEIIAKAVSTGMTILPIVYDEITGKFIDIRDIE